jgi:hypothetical protein
MRWRRVTDFVAETSTNYTLDEATLERFAGARKPDDQTLNNVTAVLLELSTQINTIEGSRKFNCIAKRLLPDYSTGEAVGMEKTNSIADAVAYTLIEQAGYSAAEIDLAGLYANFDLSKTDFRGVIDKEMSADDQVAMLLDVGNGYAYRRAGIIHFVRDKTQTIPRTLFNRRNKVEPEEKTMLFGQADEPDAIEVTFFDQNTNYKQVVVTYPDIAPVRPKTMTLIGKTTWIKAWRRARREWDLIQYRRDTLSMVVTEEGALLGPGDLIAVTDHLRDLQPIDGEVVAIDAKIITVDVDPSAAAPGDIVRLRNKDGIVMQETTVVSTVTDTVELADSLTVSASDNPTASTGILFEIVPAADGPKEQWLVQEVAPQQDGAVRIECVNYADEVYDADSATPPEQP